MVQVVVERLPNEIEDGVKAGRRARSVIVSGLPESTESLPSARQKLDEEFSGHICAQEHDHHGATMEDHGAPPWSDNSMTTRERLSSKQWVIYRGELRRISELSTSMNAEGSGNL
ncbi:hypothetical protein Aduo_010719 [Ancylostoma duodenale]